MPDQFSFVGLAARPDLSADLTVLGATYRNVDGVRIATMPDDRWFLGARPDDFRIRNEGVRVPTTPVTALPFAHPDAVPSAAELRQFVLNGNQGVVRGHDNRYKAVAVPHFERAQLVCVRFLELAVVDCGLVDPHPLFVSPPGRMIVPFLGDIHAAGGALTTEQLAQIGLRFLLDAEGQPIEYLATMQGNRSIYFPSRLGIGLEAPGYDGPLGWQFKGTGVPRYLYHTVRNLGAKTRPHDPGDVLIEGADLAGLPHGRASQRPAYAGRSGIFDLPHQTASIVPIGGETDPQEGIAAERSLKQRGITSARDTVQVGLLLDPTQLTQLTGVRSGYAAPLYVVCETWQQQGSTLRLEVVTRPFRICQDGSNVAKQQAGENLDAIIRAELGVAQVTPEHRLAKLRTLAQQFGKNLRIGLETGLSPWLDRNTDDNLTTVGGQLDYGDFVRVHGWHELLALGVRYLYDLQRQGQAAGMSSVTVFENGVIEMFLQAFVPTAEIQTLCDLGAKRFRTGQWSTIQVEESAQWVSAARDIVCRFLAPWVVTQITVDKAKVSHTVRYIDPHALREFLATNREFSALVTEARISTSGPVLEVAARLLRPYVRFVLAQHLLLKDRAAQRKPTPPLKEFDPAGMESFLAEKKKAEKKRKKR